jgi:bifunctional N-acetylglucosamine-1-phosphate-uridyltransferase/glucosamine-1-phosphate-acetyltransferase GlmU-like protein
VTVNAELFLHVCVLAAEGPRLDSQLQKNASIIVENSLLKDKLNQEEAGPSARVVVVSKVMEFVRG